MKIIKAVTKELHGIDGSRLRISYDNMGEPFREGVRIAIESEGESISALLEADDVKRLVAALDPFFNATPAAKHELERRLYDQLFYVRERLGKLADRKSIREQSDEDEINSINQMVNQAIAVLIGTSR